MAKNNQWLEALQPGDAVIVVHPTLHGWARSIGRVMRGTKTRVMIEYQRVTSAFRRTDGHMVAGSWDSPYLEQATPELSAEIKAEARRRTLTRRIQNANLADLSMATIENVHAALLKDERFVPIS